jgi:hypothetical protein
MKLTKKQRMVYNVIKANDGVQNNDAKLVAAVWRHEGWSDSISLEENLRNVTNSETITRCRRYLHERGYITYSREADAKRMEAFKECRDKYSQGSFLDRFFK